MNMHFSSLAKQTVCFYTSGSESRGPPLRRCLFHAMNWALSNLFLLLNNVELSGQLNRLSIDGSQSQAVWRNQILAQEEGFNPSATC